MSGRLNSSPETKIYEIEDLMEKVWRGQIRVPYFQRDYRWGHQDVARLFQSIQKGYPIGSLLLWKRPAAARRITLGALEIDAPEADDALWVVDGQQRITSLANALHPEAGYAPSFALEYDLRADRFVTPSGRQRPWLIPLPVLFDYQLSFAWLSEHPESTEYADRIPAIAKIIRQFKIPAYLVETDDTTALQEIFDRMNNYGKRLKRAEVFSALHAGDEESPTRLTFSSIADDIAERRKFGLIDADTVLQALLARRGPDILRDIRIEFDDETRRGSVDFRGEGRDAAYEHGAAALDRAVWFLQEEAGVPHFALLPYRYLLVILARFFAHFPEAGQWERQLLRRWFWRTVLVGHAKSSPASAIRDFNKRIVTGDLSGSIDRLFKGIVNRSQKQPELRRFRMNDAATKVVLCAWWHKRPVSPTTGEPFDADQLAEIIDDRATAIDAISYLVNPRSVSEELRKWAALRVLLPDYELAAEEVGEHFARYRPATNDGGDRGQEAGFPGSEEDWHAFLRSHGVTREAARLLAEERVVDFLTTRHATLQHDLDLFVRRMCEWTFEDTPPLESLILDDEDPNEEDDTA